MSGGPLKTHGRANFYQEGTLERLPRPTRAFKADKGLEEIGQSADLGPRDGFVAILPRKFIIEEISRVLIRNTCESRKDCDSFGSRSREGLWGA